MTTFKEKDNIPGKALDVGSSGVVGVRLNADGTKDYSRAATMELPRKNSEKPQEWLDNEREQAYEKLKAV